MGQTYDLLIRMWNVGQQQLTNCNQIQTTRNADCLN